MSELELVTFLNVLSQMCHYIVNLQQQCHNSKFVIIQEKYLKVLKCYNFL